MRSTLVIVGSLVLASSAFAGTYTMTFEGLTNGSTVGSAYAGSGFTYEGAGALVATQSGDLGSTGNQGYDTSQTTPSPYTAIIPQGGGIFVLDTNLPGAITGLSFWYTSPTGLGGPLTLNLYDVHDGVNNGNFDAPVASETLAVTPAGNSDSTDYPYCAAAPYCPFVEYTLPTEALSGYTASPDGLGSIVSFDFAGGQGTFAIDDVTVTWQDPVNNNPGAPEPSTMALFAGGAALIGLSRKYLRKKA